MKIIAVNKGNYSMDTYERELAFEQKKAGGWESEYDIYRENWVKYPKEGFVSKWPLLVDLELSTACNLKCPMCCTTLDEFKKKVERKFMDFELFTKMIDEIAGHVPAIRLSVVGESTLHPRFVDCIAYAKKKGIKEVSFLTNGSTLSKDFFEKIMMAGADWITVSVDGMDEVYENIRKPLKFKDIFEKMKTIKEIKQKHGFDKPVIKIQTVWPSIKSNPEEFYNKFVDYVDLMAFNPLIDFLGNDDETQIVYEDDFKCPAHYRRIIVAPNGDYFMCPSDNLRTVVLGNAYNENLYDVWHGEKFNRVRELHKKDGGFKKIGVCKGCYHPRKTIDDEKAFINGREIIIKNYINRPQEIGK